MFDSLGTCVIFERKAECLKLVDGSGFGVGFLLVIGTLARFLWDSVCGAVILAWTFFLFFPTNEIHFIAFWLTLLGVHLRTTFPDMLKLNSIRRKLSPKGPKGPRGPMLILGRFL